MITSGAARLWGFAPLGMPFGVGYSFNICAGAPAWLIVRGNKRRKKDRTIERA